MSSPKSSKSSSSSPEVIGAGGRKSPSPSPRTKRLRQNLKQEDVGRAAIAQEELEFRRAMLRARTLEEIEQRRRSAALARLVPHIAEFERQIPLLAASVEASVGYAESNMTRALAIAKSVNESPLPQMASERRYVHNVVTEIRAALDNTLKLRAECEELFREMAAHIAVLRRPGTMPMADLRRMLTELSSSFDVARPPINQIQLIAQQNAKRLHQLSAAIETKRARVLAEVSSAFTALPSDEANARRRLHRREEEGFHDIIEGLRDAKARTAPTRGPMSMDD